MKSINFILIFLINTAITLAGVNKVVKLPDNRNYLPVRSGPNIKDKMVEKLKLNQYIYATESSNGWKKFYKGYVREPYLQIVQKGTTYETKTDAKFRVGPATNQKLLKTLKKGTKIKYFGNDPWTKDWAVTNQGYVIAKNIKKSTEQTTESKVIPSPVPTPRSVKSLVTTLLKSEEGKGPNGICGPYRDHLGYPTIGYGQLCEHRVVSSDAEARAACSNFVNGCTEAKALEWLGNKIDEIINKCINGYDHVRNAYNMASDKRKAILISMAYQMGYDGLAEFTNTLGLMAQGNWAAAADNMMTSLWARQTPERAERHSYVIRNDSCRSDICSKYEW